MKSLIKAGARYTICGTSVNSFYRRAILTVKIRNAEAGFKVAHYGNIIVVQRTFTQEGGNSYKLINGETNAVVSHRREELDDVCDFFSIQVENPLVFLSQDTARQFLSSASDKEKYGLFMKGIQLQQLQTGYELLRSKLQTASTMLALKERSLQELGETEESCRSRVDECEVQNTLRQQIADSSVEFAWVQHHKQNKVGSPVA